MIHGTKSLCLSALIFLGLFTYPTQTSAETIVRHERTRHSAPAPKVSTKKQPTSNSTPRKTEPTPTASNDVSNHHKQQSVEEIKEPENITLPPIVNDDSIEKELLPPKKNVQSTTETDISDSTDTVGNPAKDAFLGTYFSKFKLIGPKTKTYFGDAGDLAGLSSAVLFSSDFHLLSHEEEERLTVSFYKYRIAWALGSRNRYGFSMEYNLDCQPIVSNKKKPKFEMNNNGIISEKDTYTLKQYGSNRFIVEFHDEDKIKGIIESGANLSVLLPKLDGDYLRIPIPQQAISQWKEVLSVDLKALKKKYDSVQ